MRRGERHAQGASRCCRQRSGCRGESDGCAGEQQQACLTTIPETTPHPKVLRLEGTPGRGGAKPAADAAAGAPAAAAAPGGAAAATAGALSLNQNLAGHSGAVTGVAWNGPYQKLASSDEGGLIIVWALHDGAWCEEMINNRRARGGARGTANCMAAALAWPADGLMKRHCRCSFARRP